jgi:hypothetical protein
MRAQKTRNASGRASTAAMASGVNSTPFSAKLRHKTRFQDPTNDTPVQCSFPGFPQARCNIH